MQNALCIQGVYSLYVFCKCMNAYICIGIICVCIVLFVYMDVCVDVCAVCVYA